MKCTSRRRLAIGLSCALLFGLTGCGKLSYDMPYSASPKVSSFNTIPSRDSEKVPPFATDLCIVTGDLTYDDLIDLSTVEAAGLFDLNDGDVLYAKNMHERLYPASLTKVMTALVALQNGSLDQKLTATGSVNITESGATLCGVKSGDSMTLDQALHILLMYSANDVAMMIAESIGGSVDGFVEMMNEEAVRLGATNTHFMNPNGLSDEQHYTTAYDMYLIFNEAIKYDTFNEIIHMTSYDTVYYDGNGREKNLTVNTTNQFLRGGYTAPDNVTVIGGKTGTTSAAKSCLILLVRDAGGAPYISVILKAETGEALYSGMTLLLEQINR
ncbi:MAG: serine hydrolase [Candidatus Gastranaerophilales bacterium]|nr:serine hydrolase [Candidatus Gastranaerophilales bacterium]